MSVYMCYTIILKLGISFSAPSLILIGKNKTVNISSVLLLGEIAYVIVIFDAVAFQTSL